MYLLPADDGDFLTCIDVLDQQRQSIAIDVFQRYFLRPGFDDITSEHGSKIVTGSTEYQAMGRNTTVLDHQGHITELTAVHVGANAMHQTIGMAGGAVTLLFRSASVPTSGSTSCRNRSVIYGTFHR